MKEKYMFKPMMKYDFSPNNHFLHLFVKVLYFPPHIVKNSGWQ